MLSSSRTTLLFAGTQAGLFRIRGTGLSWESVRSGLNNMPTLSLAFDAPNAVLYAGAYNGTYFSRDGGENWQRTGNVDSPISVLALDLDAKAIFAATYGWVYRSLDSGTSWKPVGEGLPRAYPSALIIMPDNGLYAGTEVGLYKLDPGANGWHVVDGALATQNARALVFDRSTNTLFAGTHTGVFRLAGNEKTWQKISQGLLDPRVSSLALDVEGTGLYAGSESGSVFRWNSQGLQWEPAGANQLQGAILSLVAGSTSGELYAGMGSNGVYYLPGRGDKWRPVAEGLPDVSVFTVMLVEREQERPIAGETLSGGLYWHERYPVEIVRLEASREALATLQTSYAQTAEDVGKAYPWRLGLSPSTGLPALLRAFLPQALVGDAANISPKISSLLDTTQAQAVFGLREQEQARLETELEPQPIITLTGGETRTGAILQHFVWRQVFKGHPVVGGGVRVHGLRADQRIAVTSSYFPIPDSYNFAPDPTIGEDPLAPRLTLDQACQYALEAMLQATSIADKRPFWAAVVEQALARHDVATLSQALISLQRHMTGTLGRWLILIVVVLLRQGALLRRLGWLVLRLIWPILGTDAEAAHCERVSIDDHELAIMPFAAAYHLISRIRILVPRDSPWYIDVDMKTGQALGQPWQSAIHSPKFYKTSGEAMPGGASTGDANTINVVQLRNYVANLPVDLVNQGSIELTNAAAHAQRLHDHLVNVCGVLASQLEGPSLSIEVGSSLPTGFDYDEALSPKVIRFQLDGGSGITIGNQLVYAPALDPEVVMHEFAHGFLWKLNSEPWDTLHTLGPFGRALQEGYAMYLARSVAAREAGEEQQIWARAAYSSDKRTDRSLDWGDRWALRRSSSVVGADLLPASNIYPAGSYSLQTPAGYDLAYDVGMIWARALWDLRELVGGQQADFLAVHACPYLHGYVANFEMAAEGLLDADIKLANGINLTNGSQPIWAIRGIAAGQGIRGFAQATINGTSTLIAASDAGILTSPDGVTWALETANFAGGTLTGVVAVAADGNTLYAAVEMPVFDTTGNRTQWGPNIFFRSAPGAWQPLGDWLRDTGEATPLCLLARPGGEIWVGTSHGVYSTTTSTRKWSGIGTLSDVANSFTALGIGLAQIGTLTLVRACSPDGFHQISAVPLQGQWSSPAANPFGVGVEARPTCLAVLNNKTYLGTLSNGPWEIITGLGGATAQPIANIANVILALAASPTHLYLATDNAILQYGGAIPAVSLGLPHPDAKVLSLFVTSNNVPLAGTLAHGIWQHDGTRWQPVYSPPRPPQIILAAGEKALLSALLTNANPISYSITVSGSVQLLKVATPGFPLQEINPVNNRYTLAHGPVILLLENTSGAGVTRTLNVREANQTIDIS